MSSNLLLDSEITKSLNSKCMDHPSYAIRQNIKNKREVPDRKSTDSRILILMLSNGEKINCMIYLFSIAVKRVPG